MPDILTAFIGLFLQPDINQCLADQTMMVTTEQVVMNPHPQGTEADPYLEELHGPIECSCIRYARSKGIKIPYGINAKDLTPNAEPEVGVLVLIDSKVAHVSVVTSIDEIGYWITEGNWQHCKETKRRIPKNHHSIRGFWKPLVVQ